MYTYVGRCFNSISQERLIRMLGHLLLLLLIYTIVLLFIIYMAYVLQWTLKVVEDKRVREGLYIDNKS